MADKYIIELKDGETLYKAVIGADGEPYITPAMGNVYTEPDTEKIREEAYEQGKMDAYVEDSKNITMLKKEAEEAYQRGLNDAWEAVQKIANMPYSEEEKAFGSGGWSFIDKHTASEAIEKIRQYEQKQKQEEEQIQVGDEVRNIENRWIAVVCNIEGECMTLMGTNGALGGGYHVNRFTKTGRHFPEIAEVLRKMKGES